VLGLSPLEAGLWTVPWALAFVAGSMLTPALVRRVRPGAAIAGGFAIATLACALLPAASRGAGPALLIATTMLLSIGLSPVFTLATDQIVGSVPPERAGVASAISETSSEFGGALGIAILGSIGTAVYRGVMRDTALPVPPDAMEAARGTLGAATAVAGQLPGEVGNALLDASRSAFVQGFELTAVLGALTMLASAVLAARMLRMRPKAA